MALNFGQYVYKPHQLQEWDYGKGFRDLAAARRDQQSINNQDRQARESLAETTAGRGDLNTRFAAQFAAARSKEEHDEIKARYDQQLAAIEQGRKSALTGKYNDARAAGARASELGGTYEESAGRPGHPNFRFRASGAPGMQPLDVQGTRNSIFGGGGGGPQQQPQSPTPGSFDMRSNIGPGSPPAVGRNPFERLPGASAAALPPPPAPPVDAGPPPGPAEGQLPQVPSFQLGAPPPPSTTIDQDIDNLRLNLDSYEAGGSPTAATDGQQRLPVKNPALPSELERPDAEVLAEPEDPNKSADILELEANIKKFDEQQAARGLPTTEQQQPAEAAPEEIDPQASGVSAERNPYNPPAFDPYRISTSDITAENTLRLKPLSDSLKTGVPGKYRHRIEPFADALGQMGYEPGETLQLAQPTFGTLASLMRSEMQSEAAKASLGIRAQSASNTMSERLRSNADRRTNEIAKRYDLTKQIARRGGVRDAVELLNDRTGQSDRAAISMIRDLYENGIMTDEDFRMVLGGASKTWLTALKEKTWAALIGDTIHPDVRRKLMQVATHAQGASERKILDAQNQMAAVLRNNRTWSREEREANINSISSAIPIDMWDPDIAAGMGEPVDQKSGPMDQSGNYPVTPTAKPKPKAKSFKDKEAELLDELAGSVD